VPTTDARVDAYIAKAPEYARPILDKLRGLVHRADKELEETIKWGAPNFVKAGIVCSMVAFKKHVGFWFPKGALLEDPKGLFNHGDHNKAMRAVNITESKSMDVRGLTALVKQAVAVNLRGDKPPAAKAKPVAVPPELRALLAKNRKAKAFFDGLAPSHRRAYVDWIEEAKREQTRARRLTQTLEMLAQGKRRGDEYR
jgi:hypothetical protein